MAAISPARTFTSIVDELVSRTGPEETSAASEILILHDQTATSSMRHFLKPDAACSRTSITCWRHGAQENGLRKSAGIATNIPARSAFEEVRSSIRHKYPSLRQVYIS